MKKNTASPETQQQALKLAKHIQKPGQSKEQTKIIAQGIQKGIEQYKKAQKAKARDADKFKKKQRKAAAGKVEHIELEQQTGQSQNAILPWVLLVLSWVGFAIYLFAI